MECKKKKGLLSWIFEFAEQKKFFYIASVALAFLSVAAGLAPYLFIARIVGRLLDGEKNFSLYLNECAAAALFWLLNVSLHAASTSLSHVATFSLLGNVRKSLCEKLSRVPLGTVLDIPSGSLKNILVERIDSMETTLAHIAPEYTSNLALPLAMFAYLFFLDWRIGLASLATLPLGLAAMSLMFVNAKERFACAIEKTKALNDTAVEYINGIEVIKAFGKSKSSYEKFVTAAKEGSDCYVEWMRDNIWPMAFTLAVAPSTPLAVLPIGGLLFSRGALSAQDFITTIIFSMSVIQPLVTAFSYHDDLAKAGVIFGEVGGLMELEELSRPEACAKAPRGNSVVLRDVRFSYKKEGRETGAAERGEAPDGRSRGREILHGINMSIQDGQYVALVGPSGSGKSALARLIASLWDPDSGSIEIGGVDIRDIPLSEYNRRAAYVSQDNFLFDMSARENIRLGRPGATDEEVEKAAREAGCHDFISALEKGYDTIVGSGGSHLSGGERQRIAIARAMMKDAPIVILDEATAYTDPESEAAVQEGVARLVKGKTLIVIAHRLSTVKDADEIFVIKDGRIDSRGRHEELLAAGGLYKDMWEAHASAKDE